MLGNFRRELLGPRVRHVDQVNIKILLLIVVHIVLVVKYRPVQLMRTVIIVVQDNTVLQPQYVQIADQDNIVSNRQIVNVLIA